MRARSSPDTFVTFFRTLLAPLGERFVRKRKLSPALVVAGLLLRHLECFALTTLAQQVAVLFNVHRLAASSWCRAFRKVTPEHMALVEQRASALLAAAMPRLRRIRRRLGLTGAVYAIDGTRVAVPRSSSTITAFGLPGYVPWQGAAKSVAHFPQAMLVTLYDVLLQRPVAWVTRPHAAEGGEIAAAKALIAHLKPGDIVLFDRAYPSLALMQAITRKKAFYIIRMRRGKMGWRCIRQFDDDQATKRTVTLTNGTHAATFRLLRGYCQASQATERDYILATNLTVPARWIRNCYAMRWAIETFFRHLKHGLHLDQLRSRTAEAIRRDIAIVFILCQLITTIDIATATAPMAWPDGSARRFPRPLLVAALTTLLAGLFVNARAHAAVVARCHQNLIHSGRKPPKQRPGRAYPRVVKAVKRRWDR